MGRGGWGNTLPIIFIMSSLGEDQFVRAERQRKQELYRLMLDQQVRYNQDTKREASSHLIKTNPQEPRNPAPRTQQYGASPEGRYLPAIANSQRELSVGRTPLRGSESERTQVYLSNCEEIIRNLRDLKSKRMSKDIPAVPQPPPASVLYPIHQKTPSYEAQYYPKASYFSSASNSFTKQSQLDPTPKTSKLRPARLKTIEDSETKRTQEAPFKLTYKSIRSKSTKTKIFGKQKGEVSEEMKERTGRDPEKESDQPLGIVDTQRKQLTNGSNSNRAPISQEEEQNRKKQEELSLCLIQLTKYLKTLNDQKEQHHTQTSNQGNLSTDKIDQSSQREDMPPNSYKSIDKKDAATHPDQILEQDQEEEEDQQEIPKQPQTNVEKLKLKALLALRKLNQRSRSFLLKMGTRRVKQSDKTSEQSTDKSPSEQQDSRSSPRPISSQLQIQSRQPSSLQSQPTLITNSKPEPKKVDEKSNIQSKPEQKGGKKSEELVKMMMQQLQKQEGQNDNLTYCIKELTEYLKNQNEEIEVLKNSREKHQNFQKEQGKSAQQVRETEQGQRQSDIDTQKDSRLKHPQKQVKKNESKGKPSKNGTEKVNKIVKTEQKQEEKNQEAEKNEKDNTIKLQEAVLKRLKKARMRGNLFKQKVENFRKSHSTRSQVTNKPASSPPDQPQEEDPQLPAESGDTNEDP